MKKVAVVGAGASGLFCAVELALSGCEVELFEQNAKVAKKILVSGNGRCNITNTDAKPSDYYSQNSDFTTYALDTFNFNEFKKFTSKLGLELDVKDDGRVYPLSNEAKSVASLLLHKALDVGVKLHTDTKITSIKELKKKFDKVVVATGSESASHLGGNRDGLEFAKELGHNIIPTYPSLVQLHLAGDSFKKMSGVKVDAEVSVLINNKKTTTTSGDVLFTNYGVSGFAILDASNEISSALVEYQMVDIVINLLPRFTTQKLASHIMKISQISPTSTLEDILHGLVPIKIAKTVLELLKLPPTMLASELNTKLSKKISNQISNLKFEVTQTHGFRYAEVAGGGVDTQEINPKTMESLKEKDFYFCGEVLDVVGRRGGFNFAWAWASAKVCSMSI